MSISPSQFEASDEPPRAVEELPEIEKRKRKAPERPVEVACRPYGIESDISFEVAPGLTCDYDSFVDLVEGIFGQRLSLSYRLPSSQDPLLHEICQMRKRACKIPFQPLAKPPKWVCVPLTKTSFESFWGLKKPILHCRSLYKFHLDRSLFPSEVIQRLEETSPVAGRRRTTAYLDPEVVLGSCATIPRSPASTRGAGGIVMADTSEMDPYERMEYMRRFEEKLEEEELMINAALRSLKAQQRSRTNLRGEGWDPDPDASLEMTYGDKMQGLIKKKKLIITNKESEEVVERLFRRNIKSQRIERDQKATELDFRMDKLYSRNSPQRTYTASAPPVLPQLSEKERMRVDYLYSGGLDRQERSRARLRERWLHQPVMGPQKTADEHDDIISRLYNGGIQSGVEREKMLEAKWHRKSSKIKQIAKEELDKSLERLYKTGMERQKEIRERQDPLLCGDPYYLPADEVDKIFERLATK